MAVYKPYRKTELGKDEIKIPYSSIDGTPTIPTVNDGLLSIAKNGEKIDSFSANSSEDMVINITVPTKVSELTNDSGFTTNTGTITGIKMNGASKGTSGVVDLGTVITDISGKANLSGGNTFSDLQTINAPTNVSGSEQTTMKVKTSNGGAIIFGKEANNSGTMIRIDQTDGTCRLRFRGSSTAGAMVWEQPEQGAQLYVDLGLNGSDKHRVQFPSSAGTLALTSQIPTKTSALTNDSGYLTEHQDISGKANLSGGNTFSGTQVITGYLDIRGTAAEKHLKTRGIGGSDGNGNSNDLYLQYSSDYKTYFGKTAQSSLNSDGSISVNGKTVATTNQIPTFTLSGTTLTITTE